MQKSDDLGPEMLNYKGYDTSTRGWNKGLNTP